MPRSAPQADANETGALDADSEPVVRNNLLSVVGMVASEGANDLHSKLLTVVSDCLKPHARQFGLFWHELQEVIDSSIGVNADTLDELLRFAMSMSGDAPADEAPWEILIAALGPPGLQKTVQLVGETSARSS